MAWWAWVLVVLGVIALGILILLWMALSTLGDFFLPVARGVSEAIEDKYAGRNRGENTEE